MVVKIDSALTLRDLNSSGSLQPEGTSIWFSCALRQAEGVSAAFMSVVAASWFRDS